MKLDFVKISPSQNMTVFVTSDVDPKDYANVGNTLMAYDYVNAEQAGFIVDPVNKNTILRLEMSGGEFCGNAVLAAAAYSVYKGLTTENQFFIEASGADLPLLCDVEMKSEVLYHAKGEMPQALSTEDTVISLHGRNISGTLVKLEGITHFVINVWPDKDDFQEILSAINEITEDKAIGIIPYRHINNETYEIRPFISVTNTGSTFFERSCGSGTLALGIYLAHQSDENIFAIQQPGGTIDVEIGTKNYISTDVQITCEGVAYIP